MNWARMFFLLWGVSIAAMYFFFTRAGGPMVLPGDFYMRRGNKTIYIPVGSSFFLTIVLFIILKLLLPGR